MAHPFQCLHATLYFIYFKLVLKSEAICIKFCFVTISKLYLKNEVALKPLILVPLNFSKHIPKGFSTAKQIPSCVPKVIDGPHMPITLHNKDNTLSTSILLVCLSSGFRNNSNITIPNNSCCFSILSLLAPNQQLSWIVTPRYNTSKLLLHSTGVYTVFYSSKQAYPSKSSLHSCKHAHNPFTFSYCVCWVHPTKSTI